MSLRHPVQPIPINEYVTEHIVNVSHSYVMLLNPNEDVCVRMCVRMCVSIRVYLFTDTATEPPL